MNRRLLPLGFLVLFVAGCGRGPVDGEGLAGKNDAFEQFTRASQLYFRGRLTASMEEFNGVVYRFPDSPFAADARLAVRRIESDLSGMESQNGGDSAEPSIDSRIAVVGRSAAAEGIARAAGLLRGAGASVTEITDQQAPEMTMVFIGSGFEEQGAQVADSLEHWLQRPEEVVPRPGDELIETVSPGFDVLVIIGEDALFETYAN